MRQLMLSSLLTRQRGAGKSGPVAGTEAARLRRRRAAPLHRHLPSWAGRLLRPAFAVTFSAVLLFVGVAVWRSGGFAELGLATGDAALRWSGDSGIAIGNVLVEGREKTPTNLILEALEVQRGMPMLAFSPERARARLLQIGWVKDARVERRLPDTVYVDIVERRPAAIWQHKGEFALVDESGIVIGRDEVPEYSHLKVIVGPDAPENFAEFFDMLESQPHLKDRVVAAVRVGSRRWNVTLDNDMTVLLPETEIAEAWARLAQAARDGALLERDATRIDLRMPDRITVRRAPGAAAAGDKGV